MPRQAEAARCTLKHPGIEETCRTPSDASSGPHASRVCRFCVASSGPGTRVLFGTSAMLRGCLPLPRHSNPWECKEWQPPMRRDGARRGMHTTHHATIACCACCAADVAFAVLALALEHRCACTRDAPRRLHASQPAQGSGNRSDSARRSFPAPCRRARTRRPLARQGLRCINPSPRSLNHSERGQRGK